jgi:peptidoglycan glycosyltransferase
MLRLNKAHNNPKKSLYNVIYIFSGLFVLIMIYFSYFLIVKSEDTINNAYNNREKVLAERVLRGKILSAGREVLAETAVDEDGSESRYYPCGDMFAHVVGRYDKGLTGIEEVENIRLLSVSRNSFSNMLNDMAGEKSPGNNVVTTLNLKLQQAAYDALGDKRGAVVVMEPSTGKILAMVSKPSYDPNTINEQWDSIAKDEEESPLFNRAAQGLYPPGSTFKLLTALEFIRENPDYEGYLYDCDGSISYEGMTIHCSKGKAHGEVDLEKSFSRSCNTSFSRIGRDLDIGTFRTLCEDFLFNKNLPVTMASSQSRFELKEGRSGIKEKMQTAIGQGNTLISPLHNLMIASAVANNGVMMKPYVVDRIESYTGKMIKGYVPREYATPMTIREADFLKRLMREVVTGGTADELNSFKVPIAGKTGSAEQEGKPAHAWFIGFAPVGEPEIAVSVIVESSGSGSEYAVPIARKILDAYFSNEAD